MRSKLEKRLSYLYTGETMSLIVFIPLSFLLSQTFPQLRLYSLASFWISFFLLEFLLVQGSMYWHSKWKRLKHEDISLTPIRIIQRLRRFKKWNIGLIIVAPFMFLIDFLLFYSSLPIGGLVLSACIYIFAVLEYINYFHIQLSYDNLSDIKYLVKAKRLKQSSLNRDLERNG